MKGNYLFAAKFALVCVIILIGSFSIFSQKSIESYPTFAKELRPFDFSDKFYYENGVEPAFIVNRRDGTDKHSVFDAINDPRFRNVRIRSVFPAYNQDGKIFYWNLYGELFKDGFRQDESGRRAIERAEIYPLYLFPSTNRETEFRQAHLIQLRDSYFEKNFLGLSV